MENDREPMAGAPLEQYVAGDPGTDPDLAHIISAWPRLRDKVKAAILVMVEAATH
jgi:hypothetical protein